MEEYGEQRMIDTLSTQTAHTCRETINGLLQNVRDFAGEAEQSDDITILALKRLG